jgi:ABC-type nitrate/sulfonate/bicarbonate transport system substrate-binding protein
MQHDEQADRIHACVAGDPDLSRRGFLKASMAGGMAAAGILGMAPGEVKSAAHTSERTGPEKTDVTFGIIPLTDCAVIVVAHEKGYFKKYGLNSSVSREASWANIRDKVALGVLDGAHMLAGMPIAATLGLGLPPTPMVTAFSMDLNGNGITVSNDLYARMLAADPEAMRERPLTARALKKVIDANKLAGRPPMTFAMVFPVSTHNYEIRYWMAAAGIDPDRDVQLIVIPPPQMVANLQSRNIDGYCVGEPWNARAVTAGIGHTLITSYEIWNNGPEKVFGVNREWAEKYPNTHRAAIMALIDAAQWMDKPENRDEVARLISGPAYVDAPVDEVRMSMTGTFRYSQGEAPRPLPDFNVFHRYAANFPWRSHAVWFLTQMIRWGQIETPLDIHATAATVYRPDLYRDAAQALGVPVPIVDEKVEGAHATTWTLNDASAPIVMGPDRFFDGRIFEPARPIEYLAGFDICSPNVALAALAATNLRGMV